MAAQVHPPWQFFDMFLDVPHPAASPHSAPQYVIPAPAEQGHDNIEQELAKSIPQISRFAFPEYDQDANPPPPPPDQAPPINRFDQYAMQPPAFQNYTFSLTLQSGVRVYGHVRRYLPCHIGAKTRYDVGRRGERALVILTRVTRADLIYSAVLKTIDAISSHRLASPHHFPEENPQQAFLFDIFHRHQNLASVYVSKPSEARNKPVFLTLQDIEVETKESKLFSAVDSTHFLLPPPLLIRTSMGDLVSNTSSTSILPVLRCLGVAHTLRLLCALLSERRVILISASPTRLATCCKSAVAILAQGLLQWQHLYIPVLPPHLWQYLAAPYPYLIGILASLTPRLDRTDGLGEVLLINLDHNTMETRGIPTDQIENRIPDLLRNMGNQDFSVQALGQGGPPPSAPELLAQDLVETLKNDKKTLNGESALASMQETATKATKAVKATFFKLKDKGMKYLKQSSYNENESQEEQEPVEPPDANPMAPDFIYTEGCRNEMGEEEARLAFCAFFVSMIGDMRWYLSAQPGQPPQLDRKRFLQQKQREGDGEYSTMWPLLHNFCQTQMLEEFAKARVEELRTRQPVTSDSPLFLQCSNYHNTSKIDFSLLSVRRVSRQVLQTNPSRMLQQTNARRMAMELTSKRTFEGDYNKALADLVEQCRECSSVLFDVMSVVWIRMRDNRGLQWRHATNSLHILKNLLFHGPLAAVAEATDGLDKIRALKYYNGNRTAAVCVQIRSAATQVYNIVVDRSKLFQIRRVCIARRRSLKMQNQGSLKRDSRLLKAINVPFQKVHAAMHPNAPRPAASAPRTPPPSGGASSYNATPTFAVLPPAPAQQPPRPAPQPMVAQQSGHDLLGIQQPTPAVAAPNPSGDIFGMFGGDNQRQATQPSAPAPAVANDMLGLFGDMNLGAPAPAVQTPTGQYATQQAAMPGYQQQQSPAPQGQYANQPTAGNMYAQQQQPQGNAYPNPFEAQQVQPSFAQQQQNHRSQSASPVPARGQSHSPIPPFAQQAAPNPFAAGSSMQQHHHRSVSPVPANRGQSPQRPANPGYSQAPGYTTGYQTQPPQAPHSGGYQMHGQGHAFAQPPQAPLSGGYQMHGQGHAFAQPSQAPHSGGFAMQSPQYQQAPHSGQGMPMGYGMQPQQQQQQPGAYGQGQQQQQGPFF